MHSQGSPNKREHIKNWLPHPCLLGAQKKTEMLHHRCILGDPETKGAKTHIGCLTLPYLGAQKRAEMPRILRGPQTNGDKIRNGCLNLAFSGPKRGRECYVTRAFSRVPKQKGTESTLAASPCLTGGPKEGGNATSPMHSRGSPNKRGQNQNWLPQPCLPGGPKEGRNATSPVHSRGTKGDKIRIGCPNPLPSRGPKRGRKCYVTHAFSQVHKTKRDKIRIGVPHPCLTGGFRTRAEMLRHPCILGGPPKKRGLNQNWPPHPYLPRGPKEGGNATSALHSWGSQNKRGQNPNWLPNPALPGAKMRAKMLRHPCILGGPQTKRDKIRIGCLNPLPCPGPKTGRKCYVTHAFLGVPKQKEDKIRIGCLRPQPSPQ